MHIPLEVLVVNLVPVLPRHWLAFPTTCSTQHIELEDLDKHVIHVHDIIMTSLHRPKKLDSCLYESSAAILCSALGSCIGDSALPASLPRNAPTTEPARTALDCGELAQKINNLQYPMLSVIHN